MLVAKWFKNYYSMSLLAVGVLAGCSSETDTIVMSPVPSVNNQFSIGEAWSTDVDDGVEHYFSDLQPAIAYEHVYVASRNGMVEALNPKTGEMVWEKELTFGDTPTRLAGGITAALNHLFIGSENGVLYALDAETGRTAWKAKIDGEILSLPTVDSGLVLVNSSDGQLVAFDLKTGEKTWSINSEVPNLTLRGDSSPTTIAGGVFWGTASGRLQAAIVARGQMIWQKTIGSPKGATEIDRLVDVDSKPLVLGGIIYSVGYNGNLVAIDLRSANVVWKREYSSSKDLTTDGKSIFMVTDKDHIIAVDARNGTQLWSNDKLQHRLVTAPVLLNDELVVADSQGYVYWIDRNTGEFVAKDFVDESGFAVPPQQLDDGFLIVTRSGEVKKLKIK